MSCRNFINYLPYFLPFQATKSSTYLRQSNGLNHSCNHIHRQVEKSHLNTYTYSSRTFVETFSGTVQQYHVPLNLHSYNHVRNY